jgi:hypothetical protein
MESCGRNQKIPPRPGTGRKHEFRWPALMRSATPQPLLHSPRRSPFLILKQRGTAVAGGNSPRCNPAIVCIANSGPRRIVGAGPW